MGSGVFFFDNDGKLFLLNLTYKNHWNIPGGVVDADESPRAAAIREVREEIGLHKTDLEFVCVHYKPGATEKLESLQFIFFGGVLSEDEIHKIQLQEDEVSEFGFFSEEEAMQIVSGSMQKRLKACFQAIARERPIYLE